MRLIKSTTKKENIFRSIKKNLNPYLVFRDIFRLRTEVSIIEFVFFSYQVTRISVGNANFALTEKRLLYPAALNQTGFKND